MELNRHNNPDSESSEEDLSEEVEENRPLEILSEIIPSESGASVEIEESSEELDLSEEEEEENRPSEILSEIIFSESGASVKIEEENVRHHEESSSSSSSDPCIFRTPFPGLQFQRPQLASIGPYHRGKNLPLEKYKYSFLEKFVSRTKNYGKNLCFYVRNVMTLEWRTRRCYADLPISSPEFDEMMLVDGCFILEVLRHFGRIEPGQKAKKIESEDPEQKKKEKESENGYFPIQPWQIPILVQDLLMLENQIPFFVLQKLFDLSENEEGTTTVSEPTMARSQEEPDRFTDINFKDGVLAIPPVTINDLFITILINCVAFEMCSKSRSKDLTAYVCFMISLIRHPTDVELLCSNGIISRFSYNENKVAETFNISRPSSLPCFAIPDSYLSKSVMEIRRYCTRDGNGTTWRWRHHFRKYSAIILFCITDFFFDFNSLKWVLLIIRMILSAQLVFSKVDLTLFLSLIIHMVFAASEPVDYFQDPGDFLLPIFAYEQYIGIEYSLYKSQSSEGQQLKQKEPITTKESRSLKASIEGGYSSRYSEEEMIVETRWREGKAKATEEYDEISENYFLKREMSQLRKKLSAIELKMKQLEEETTKKIAAIQDDANKTVDKFQTMTQRTVKRVISPEVYDSEDETDVEKLGRVLELKRRPATLSAQSQEGACDDDDDDGEDFLRDPE
ncbi:hypothetical protein PTKIN_Ptkin14bG0076200 [Pterospermum kingtungense]